MTTDWQYINDKMSYAKRILFLYRGFRILHKYSAKNARMSAIVNGSRTADEMTEHLRHYNGYWRTR